MWKWPLIRRKTYLEHTTSLSRLIEALREDRDDWEQAATHLGREIDKVKIKASNDRRATERAEHLARLHHGKVVQLEKKASEPLIKYDPSLKVSEVAEPDFKVWWDN